MGQGTANCLAFIQLASIRLWLRVNESDALKSERAGGFSMAGEILQRRDGLERAVERDAFFVDQGGVAEPAHPVGAVGARGQ